MSAGPNRSTQRARIFPLGQEPAEDLTASTTAEQRLEMLWALSEEAWAFTGCAMPDYSRSETPIVIVALQNQRDESDKRATGRLKDLADVEALGEKIE